METCDFKPVSLFCLKHIQMYRIWNCDQTPCGCEVWFASLFDDTSDLNMLSYKQAKMNCFEEETIQ